jgi:hypothetical protein
MKIKVYPEYPNGDGVSELRFFLLEEKDRMMR